MERTMYHLLVAIILSAFVIIGANAQCSSEGTLVGSACCCNSGYASITPTDCDDYVGNTCYDSSPIPGNFSTPSSQPSVVSLDISGSDLLIDVTGPTVQNRGCTQVSLGTGTGLNAACTSFSKSIAETSGACSPAGETWTSTISWSDSLNLCGFTLDTVSTVATVDYPTYYVYVNDIQVINTDTIDGSTQRTETSILPLRVRFPKQIQVSTDVEVIAGITLSAFLLSQSVDPTSLLATLVFSTTVNWPFQLTSATITLPSGFTQVTFTETTSGTCTTVSGTRCTQLWTLVANPGSTCVLDGLYEITAADSCRVGMTGTDCPYASGDTIPNSIIDAGISSENFCSVTDLGVDVTSALNTYSDGTFGTSKATFSQSQTAYFQFTASSTAAVITSVTLQSVSVSPTISTLYLVGSGATTHGTTADFSFANGATAASFNFLIDPTLFSTSSSQDYVVTAVVNVAYDFQGSKRSVSYVMSSPSTQTGQFAQITVNHDLSEPVSGGSSSLNPLLFASAGVILGTLALL